MPRRPRSAAPPPEAPEEEVNEEETEAVEEEAPPEKPPKKKKPRRTRGVNAEFRVSGDASEVKEALETYGGRPGEGELQAEPPSEEDDRIAEALSNPKNFARVHRIYPRRWKGRRADVHCDRFRCPVTKEDIEEDIFGRFGGKRFLVTVHPNTPTGESKTLASFSLDNPDTDEPIFSDEDPNDPANLADAGMDPTSEEVEDPLAQAEQQVNQQIRLQGRIQALKSLKEMAGSMREKADEEIKKKSSNEEDRVRALEDRIALDNLRNQLDQKISTIERTLEKMIEQESAPKKNGGDSSMMPLVLQIMRSSDQKFMSMMQTMTQMMTQKKEDKEDPLDRIIKLKSLLGKDEGSRYSKIEEMLMEMAMERLGGSGESEEESDVKFAVKQLVPVAKNYIDKKLSGSDVEAPTKEEFQKAVREEAMRITKNTLGDMQKKGYLIRMPQAGEKKGIPHDPKKKVGAPEGGEKPKKENVPQEEPEIQEIEERGEGNEVKTPPSPQSPAYDRKKAVNFVLDTIVSEIDACPENSYVPGDIMDRLDDEFLEEFLKIANGDDLKALVKPYADPEKLEKIEAKGKEDRKKSWLTRMVVTAQDEIRREWDSAGPSEEVSES